MPSGNLRMLVPPFQMREAKVQIRQAAADCDVADSEWRLREQRGLLLQRFHGRSVLLSKCVEQLLRGLRSLPFVSQQQQEVEKSVSECLAPQRRQAGGPRRRKEFGARVQGVQIFADHT